MSGIMSLWARVTGILSGTVVESIALLMLRIALAGVFWRSYKTKIADGTWFTPNEILPVIFENDYAGLPLSADIAMPLTIYAEFLFPVLLVAGLFTRFGAAALLVMALVIQIFIFPTSGHFWGWAFGIIAMALIIISRGPGLFSLDAILGRVTGSKAA